MSTYLATTTLVLPDNRQLSSLVHSSYRSSIQCRLWTTPDGLTCGCVYFLVCGRLRGPTHVQYSHPRDPPLPLFRLDLRYATRVHCQLLPAALLACHLGLYKFEVESEFLRHFGPFKITLAYFFLSCFPTPDPSSPLLRSPANVLPISPRRLSWRPVCSASRKSCRTCGLEWPAAPKRTTSRWKPSSRCRPRAEASKSYMVSSCTLPTCPTR